ncbi:hypothetical protein [Nocardia macrotermitis]|nr:hypothetical protein [Nocardia macrotermitis]
MPALRNGSTMIEGRVACETPGGATIAFRGGPGVPVAVAARGEARGARSAMLLGRKSISFRIGYADGSVVRVEPLDEVSIALRRGDGAAIGTILRGETVTAVAATGGTVFHVVPDAGESCTPELFRLVLLDRSGGEFGRLDVIRTVGGWASHRLADPLGDTYLWWDRGGESLPVPILGTRLAVPYPLDRVERDMALAACADIALGLRPYIPAMRSGCAVGP